MEILSKNYKDGCPTCNGVDAKSCARCHGRTTMCNWFNTSRGWTHSSELTFGEREEAEIILFKYRLNE